MMQSTVKLTSSKTSQHSPEPPPPNHNNDESKLDQAFECNICLETAKDAVVSMCGHLFCWPCLHQWLSTTDANTQCHKTCPVCKAAVSRDKVIPIYGRGGDETNRQDPRDKLPPRPPGQRTEVPNIQNPYVNVWTTGGPGGQFFGFGNGGFHMTFGASLTQSLLSYVFAIIQEFTTTTNERGNDSDVFLMRVFAYMGLIFILLTLYL